MQVDHIFNYQSSRTILDLITDFFNYIIYHINLQLHNTLINNIMVHIIYYELWIFILIEHKTLKLENNISFINFNKYL